MDKHIFKKHILPFCAAAGFSLLLASCAYIPYRPPISQGNILTEDKVAQIHHGMNKDQVRLILGTPVLTNTFSNNEWNYVYTFQHKGHYNIYRRVIIHFVNGRVSDIDPYLPAKPPRKFSKYRFHQS